MLAQLYNRTNLISVIIILKFYYLGYLGSSDRKKIVCGYAEDNRLTEFVDLGWKCGLTYQMLRSGKERITLKKMPTPPAA